MARFVKLLIIVAAVIAALGALGIGFMYSGLYNVAATERHLPFTRFILTITMEQSVRRHAAGIAVPPLDDESLVRRGLRDFQGVCVECHGAPGIGRSASGAGLEPLGPDLSTAVAPWSPAELFWIVKYGIKMTGMPAWGPTHRDDELWAIVAFLLTLPDMTEDQYRAMTVLPVVSKDRDPGEIVALAGPPGQSMVACARCHGIDGSGDGTAAFPRLIGAADYLYKALNDYASGERPSGIMGPIARALNDRQKRDVAAYYASRPAVPHPRADVAPALLQHGGALAAIGSLDGSVPACNICHGRQDSDRTQNGPPLAGQYADYLRLQLTLWKNDVRRSTVMHDIARAMTWQQIDAVAHYYSMLQPSALPTGTAEERGEQPTRESPSR